MSRKATDWEVQRWSKGVTKSVILGVTKTVTDCYQIGNEVLPKW